MKSMFPGHYPPSDEELETLWAEGLIVLDANALLNFFRYSATTRDELLELLKSEQSRLWIPHQVGLEFHRNRRGVSGHLDKAFAAVEKSHEDRWNAVDETIRSLGRHAALEAADLTQLAKRQAKKFSKKLRRARRQHHEDVTSEHAHEATFRAITELYDGRVGVAYSDAQLKDIYKEGAERYAKKIPPGYEDAKDKKGDEMYGDLVLWRQILDYGASIKKPMLFLTDDNKEDWWEKAGGRTHGPRPELVAAYNEASGERIHFYNLRRFLSYAQERGAKISDQSLEEARTVSTVEDAKRRAARFKATQRMMEEIGQIRINSPELEGMSERGRRILAGLASSNTLARDPRLNEWAREMSHIDINDSVLNRLSEQARNSLSHYGSEPQISELARQMLRRDEEAADRLRLLGLINESDEGSERPGGDHGD